MSSEAEQIASDWITYVGYRPENAPDDIFDRGWVLYDLAWENPSLAWEAIKCVIKRYSEEDLFSDAETAAKRVVGNTAAGPLEDLLAQHGSLFVQAIEEEARRDRRVFWALGGVWQNSMSDDVWLRVQKAAGNISR